MKLSAISLLHVCLIVSGCSFVQTSQTVSPQPAPMEILDNDLLAEKALNAILEENSSLPASSIYVSHITHNFDTPQPRSSNSIEVVYALIDERNVRKTPADRYRVREPGFVVSFDPSGNLQSIVRANQSYFINESEIQGYIDAGYVMLRPRKTE
ncbi:MAG: hypothetical protein AAGB06_01960 [Verrucomicrobiota bacterium]